jgi:GNAT superfamily N-acetyltransferase
MSEAPSYHTRSYSSSDFDFINDLTVSNMSIYFDDSGIVWDVEHFRKSLAGGEAFIIEIESQPVGFYHLSTDGDYGKVNTLQIVRTYQGRGIGRTVMQEITAWFQNNRVKAIKFAVFPDNPALKKYLSLGCEIESRTPQKIRMIKHL